MLNIDIAPTLLGFAGITPPSHMDGINLAGVLRGRLLETRDTFLVEKTGYAVSEDLRSKEKPSEKIHEECRAHRGDRKYKQRYDNNDKPKCVKDQERFYSELVIVIVNCD